MSPSDIKAKVDAAMTLLSESSTTFDKVRSITGLLKGINPKLDELVVAGEKHLGAIENVTQGAVIELAAGALPEGTEEEKRKKKALLLFIKYWDDLKSEVARVRAELDSKSTQKANTGPAWWNILKAAKGPLAAITILAVGVALLAATSVDIVIKNEGCSTLYSSSKMTVSIPGLRLPGEPLASGGSVTATIPPLSVTVDGTSGTSLVLTSLKFNYTIQLSKSVTDIVFDGQSLLGKKLNIDLGERKSHVLTLQCGK